MQISSFQTAAILFLAPAFTGCTTFQESPTEPELMEDPVTSFDYIDDRAIDTADPDEFVIDAVDTALADEDPIDRNSLEEDLFFDDGLEAEDTEPLPLIRQISLQAGVRDFTDDAIFGRVDSEFALGIEYAHELKNGLGFEVGGIGSLSTENGIASNPDVTGAAAEIYGGARYWFKGKRRWTPYVGAGLAAIMAGVDDDQGGQVADDQDFSLGIYAHGGVQYDMTDALFLGLDVRTLFGTSLDLETVSGDADYLQFLLVLGFRL